ncbi:MAG: radical SAM protein [Sandaracinus sp.]|nr:radical SAM protein [Sandaracinus sp.]
MRSLPVVDSRMAVHEVLAPVPDDFARDGLPTLVDGNGRAYRYLRLSVTDRCDLACVYCMPPGGEVEHAVRRELLSFEEAARLVRVFAAMGIRRVRFTGGEPLVRKDVVQLVELVRRSTEVERLALTTNATRLAELAAPLREAGLDGVNVSLDSLDAERFARLTRGGDLHAVLAGVHAALDAGLAVKLNVVLVRGENDDEAERLVRWSWERGIVPRFIELMPLGEGAKLADRRVTADQTRAFARRDRRRRRSGARGRRRSRARALRRRRPTAAVVASASSRRSATSSAAPATACASPPKATFGPASRHVARSAFAT